MSPTVSVVVPAYNNADFIEATLDSILAQTFTDFELLIADHSSTDDTWERIQRYADDPRVRLMQTPAGRRRPGELVPGHPGGDRRVRQARLRRRPRRAALPRAAGRGDDVAPPGRALLEPAHAHRRAQQHVTEARGLAGLTGLQPGRTAARRAVIVGSNIFGEPACVLMRREALERAGGWADSEPYVIDQQTFCNVLMLRRLLRPAPVARELPAQRLAVERQPRTAAVRAGVALPPPPGRREPRAPLARRPRARRQPRSGHGLRAAPRLHLARSQDDTAGRCPRADDGLSPTGDSRR